MVEADVFLRGNLAEIQADAHPDRVRGRGETVRKFLPFALGVAQMQPGLSDRLAVRVGEEENQHPLGGIAETVGAFRPGLEDIVLSGRDRDVLDIQRILHGGLVAVRLEKCLADLGLLPFADDARAGTHHETVENQMAVETPLVEGGLEFGQVKFSLRGEAEEIDRDLILRAAFDQPETQFRAGSAFGHREIEQPVGPDPAAGAEPEQLRGRSLAALRRKVNDHRHQPGAGKLHRSAVIQPERVFFAGFDRESVRIEVLERIAVAGSGERALFQPGIGDEDRAGPEFAGSLAGVETFQQRDFGGQHGGRQHREQGKEFFHGH